jgi:hypothetical protein
MDSKEVFQNKARCIRTALNILIGDDNTALKVIEFIESQPDFMVTQADVVIHLQHMVSQRIYVDLQKCGIIEASNERGILSETLKKGRAIKKYYRLNKTNWDMIKDFIINYDGCK